MSNHSFLIQINVSMNLYKTIIFKLKDVGGLILMIELKNWVRFYPNRIKGKSRIFYFSMIYFLILFDFLKEKSNKTKAQF